MVETKADDISEAEAEVRVSRWPFSPCQPLSDTKLPSHSRQQLHLGVACPCGAPVSPGPHLAQLEVGEDAWVCLCVPR